MLRDHPLFHVPVLRIEDRVGLQPNRAGMHRGGYPPRWEGRVVAVTPLSVRPRSSTLLTSLWPYSTRGGGGYMLAQTVWWRSGCGLGGRRGIYFYFVADLLREAHSRIADLNRPFEDLGLGFADAAIVALAQTLGLSRVATTDRRHVNPRAAALSLQLLPRASQTWRAAMPAQARRSPHGVRRRGAPQVLEPPCRKPPQVGGRAAATWTLRSGPLQQPSAPRPGHRRGCCTARNSLRDRRARTADR